MIDIVLDTAALVLEKILLAMGVFLMIFMSILFFPFWLPEWIFERAELARKRRASAVAKTQGDE